MATEAEIFTGFAQRLRSIEAVEPSDGQRYVKRIVATAAKHVHHCQRAGLLPLRIEGWTPAGRVSAADDTELWFFAWQTVAQVVAASYPHRIDSDVGLSHPKRLSSGGGVSVLAGAMRAGDWRERARNYAEVCDVLAELVRSPAPSDPAANGKAGDGPIPLLVTISKSRLRTALGSISESTLGNWIKNGKVELHGEHKKAAKEVTLDANQFAEPVRSKVLKAAGVDTLADATH